MKAGFEFLYGLVQIWLPEGLRSGAQVLVQLEDELLALQQELFQASRREEALTEELSEHAKVCIWSL